MSNFKKFFALLMAVIFLPLFTHAQTVANCSPTLTAQINTVQQQISYYQGVITKLQTQLATLQAKCNAPTDNISVSLVSATITKITGANASSSDTADANIKIKIKPNNSNIYLHKKYSFDVALLTPNMVVIDSPLTNIEPVAVSYVGDYFQLAKGTEYTITFHTLINPKTSGSYSMTLGGSISYGFSTNLSQSFKIIDSNAYKTNTVYLEYRGGNTTTCAKEGESVVASQYKQYQGVSCCAGLSIDNNLVNYSKMYNGECQYYTGSGVAPLYSTYICKVPSCGNGTCESIKGEDKCTCPTDCKTTEDLTALKNQAKQLLAQFNTLNCMTEMSYFDIDGTTDKTALMNYIQQLQSKIASCQNQTTCVKEGGTYQWSSRSVYDMRVQCCEGLKPMNTNINMIGAGTSYCSSKCGNGICESGYYENRVTCYQDCGSITPPSAAINITPTNSGWLWPTNRLVSFSWTSTNPPTNYRVSLYIKKTRDALGNTITNPTYQFLSYMQPTTGIANFTIPAQGVWEVYAVLCPTTNLYCKPDGSNLSSFFTIYLLPGVATNNSYTANLQNAILQLQQQLLQMQGR